MQKWILILLVAIAAAWGLWSNRPTEPAPAATPTSPPPPSAADRAGQHLRATYSPLHFKPAITTATDAQCLACHREVLIDKVRSVSPAGVKAADVKAWYQQTSTYAGDQETFHRRHIETPMAKQLMKLRCNTCHEGHDPREEAPGASATSPPQDESGFTLRKQVNPETTCLKCHGQMPWQLMPGVTGPWPAVKTMFQNNCLICHSAIRTVRHQVSYLDAEAIEKAGSTPETGGDVCYGCHGGRAWYRIPFPYARNPWPGMPAEIPDWAKTRPRQSEARFLAQPVTAATNK